MSSRLSMLIQAALLFTAIGLMFANQCHKWAHMEKASPAVRWAQRRRLVLSPEHHRHHHTPPFASHYCTANGWLNAPLNLVLRAWR